MNVRDCCILVTGGAGFVGSAVVRLLLEHTNGEVAVVENFFNGKPEFLPKSGRIKIHELDLRDGVGLVALIDELKPEVVIHLAALHFIPYCNAHPAETLDVNVTGTQNLLEACRKRRLDLW